MARKKLYGAGFKAKVALAALFDRFPHLSRTNEPVTRMLSISVRGPKTLPLVVA